MEASNFNLKDYLAHIGFEGEAKNNLSTLNQIVKKQLRKIPFENTEVQKGNIPSLVPEDIVTKILVNKRGGYCYEVNSILAMALTKLGFQWYFAGARPMFYPTLRPKTHMIVIVKLDDKEYLCDAGFGGYALRAPMLIKEEEIVQDSEKFDLKLIDDEYVLSSFVQDISQPLYAFALQPQKFIEFSLANYFNATHKDTIFTQKKLAIMQTENGRKILVDNELKLIENGVMQKIDIDYEKALQEYFGLLSNY